MITEVYLISGMHCAACSASIEKITRRMDGVKESNVNLTTEKMTITYDENKLDAGTIIKYVQSAGFGIEKEEKKKRQEIVSESKEHSNFSLILAGIFALLLLILCMGPMLFGLKLPFSKINTAIIEMLLALFIMFIGKDHFASGFKGLVHRIPNMDSLVSLSCSVSFVYSLISTFRIGNGATDANLYYESCGVVLFFIMLGKTLESNSKKKTKDAINSLISLTPLTAILVADGKQKEIKADELKLGDTVLITSGSRVPADCIIVEGDGEFDESMFTGESIPVYKGVGDKLIGGSVLSDGSIAYGKVSAVSSDTVLSNIIKFIEDAQGKKAPIASLADSIASVFVPVVLGISLVASIIWAIVGKDISFVINIFTSILVIACPCALGLATPTAIICGTGLGAKNGILIRSGENLQTASKIDTVVLDKTGTLTYGKPELISIKSLGITENELLKIAANLESNSKHPLARAVVKKAEEMGISYEEKLNEYIYVSGKGIVAEDKDERYIYAGNLKMMEEHNVDCSLLKDFYDQVSAKGQSTIFVAINNELVGALSLVDEIKKESYELVKELSNMNIDTLLLTGDNKKAAQYVAEELGINRVVSEVLPEDKANIIEELKKEGHIVAMVGDGINDAAAIAKADVGIGIGSGSDIAIDTSDIVLLKSNPKDIAKAIKLSKATMLNIKENLFWAFFYNIIGIPIAAGLLYPINGMLLSPMISGIAMSFSSVFVVSNALRLRTKKL